jgi:Tfp pilus assembly protein FimT
MSEVVERALSTTGVRTAHDTLRDSIDGSRTLAIKQRTHELIQALPDDATRQELFTHRASGCRGGQRVADSDGADFDEVAQIPLKDTADHLV